MGHSIRHLEYAVTTDKKVINADANEIATLYGDYHHELNAPIRFIDVICDDREMAYEYIKSHDKGWYDQLAVKFKEYPKVTPSKTMITLQNRVVAEKEKKVEYAKKHSVSSFKAEFVGCPNCGSKLKRTLLKGESCPLCRAELRSKTTLETLERYDNNIKSLQVKIREEEKKLQKKMESKAKVMWLVKIEYHV